MPDSVNAHRALGAAPPWTPSLALAARLDGTPKGQVVRARAFAAGPGAVKAVKLAAQLRIEKVRGAPGERGSRLARSSQREGVHHDDAARAEINDADYGVATDHAEGALEEIAAVAPTALRQEQNPALHIRQLTREVCFAVVLAQ